MLRVPSTYIPSYLGDIQAFLKGGNNFKTNNNSTNINFGVKNVQEEKKQSEIDRLKEIEEALEKNSLALDADTVSNFYTWNFTANIKQASEITRL